MESFFDLREILIAILKRLKMIITITLIFAIGWASVRFVPLAIQYLTYDSKVDETLSSSFLSQAEQPYSYQARRTLYIPPILTILGETYRDEAPTIVNSYSSLKSNVEILQPLVDEFFEESKQYDSELKQKMVDCNYRTRLVFNEEYKLTNFYSQFTVESADHVVHIYFTSSNPEFSRRVVERAEEILTAYVTEVIRPFSYKITEGQMGFWLPSPTDGLIPKTTNSLVSQTVAGAKPELSNMIKQGVKGGIIGGIAGFGLSIILVFFFQVTKSTIQARQEVEALGVRVLSIINQRKKKRFLPFIDKWVAYMEGNEAMVSPEDVAYHIILEKISLTYPEDNVSILLTGSQPQSIWESYAENLQKISRENNIEVSSSPCVITNADTIKRSKDVDGIVLIEQLDKSSIANIKLEIDEFAELNKPVLGVVLLG